MAKKPKAVSVLESEMGAVPPDDPRWAELEAKLEAGNAALESAAEGLAAPRKPEQAPAVVLPHPLELAHIGAKIVVTTEGAMLATSEGVSALPKTDPANRLPVGAKVWKTAQDEYLSDQLSANTSHPTRVYPTATEAIRKFVDDFHPLGLHS